MEYKIGDKVWVKPIDAGDLEGVIVGFQKVEPYDPIVEFEYAGEKRKGVFTLNRINPFNDGKVKPIYVRIV
jgi:hypothetical protein